MYCTVLLLSCSTCTVLYWIVLSFTALYCSIVYCALLDYTALFSVLCYTKSCSAIPVFSPTRGHYISIDIFPVSLEILTSKIISTCYVAKDYILLDIDLYQYIRILVVRVSVTFYRAPCGHKGPLWRIIGLTIY